PREDRASRDSSLVSRFPRKAVSGGADRLGPQCATHLFAGLRLSIPHSEQLASEQQLPLDFQGLSTPNIDLALRRILFPADSITTVFPQPHADRRDGSCFRKGRTNYLRGRLTSQ